MVFNVSHFGQLIFRTLPTQSKRFLVTASAVTNGIQVREAIRQALDEEMAADERVFLLGEEVAHYEGAYKCSKGIMKKYGEKRCFDTPISEMGFAGMAVGAAFLGLRPICEMMTFNFSMQCIDHIINSAAKTYYMSAGRVNVPIVFRGPNGPTPGVAAQHTQDFSSWFAFCPGLKVVIPYNSEDAKGLLKAAIQDDNPVVMLEDELLYGHTFPVSSEVLSSNFVIPIGEAKIEVPGTDVTIVSYGKSMAQAFDGTEKLAKLGIHAELINLRTLRPLDSECIKKSVKKTHRLITVEVGWPFCNIGAEISAQMAESDVFDSLDAPIQRVTGVDIPMPYSEAVEVYSMPKGDHVVKAAKKILNIS
ncbi:Pyruvate dehydrogenase E1 component subunit beta mitochondrial [Brugia pahangi]|uniref:Pyruvate dehydrogenase E1 component subunit beta n=4 Tax=Onchocercidae TaxID=6296 RepID=A0A158PRB6_BRUPA|nr:unnamed protein product [Brugia pahangi]